MAKTYAWSNFPITTVDDDGKTTTKTIKPGEPISQDDLGVSDEEWEYLLETGAVSEEEYPEDLPPDISPAEYQAAKENATSQLNEARLTVQEFGDQAQASEETQPPTPTPHTAHTAHTGTKDKE